MIATTQDGLDLFEKCMVETYLDRAGWLAARKSMIGASDSAGIFGVGYSDQCPASIYLDKRRADDADDADDADKRLKIGLIMEPALRSIFEMETGLHVHHTDGFTIFRHKEIRWLGATLDGWVKTREHGWCPVELKNVSNFNRSDWEDDQEGPLKFMVQVQHQLAVTGAQAGYLMGLIGGNEPKVIKLPRHEEFIQGMIARLGEFWNCVESGIVPPVDEAEATGRALSKLWPQDSGEAIDLPVDASEWDVELVELKTKMKADEARKTFLENKIKAALGTAAIGRLPGGGSYTWKTQVEHHQPREAKIITKRVLRRSGK